MDRRTLIVAGLASAGAGRAFAQNAAPGYPATSAPPHNGAAGYPATSAPPHSSAADYPAAAAPAQPYERDEVVDSASNFLGVAAEAIGKIVEKAFKDNGRPTAYIAGEEGGGAVVVGLRYGKGLLYMKGRPPMEVYWQGPSAGWDFGMTVGRTFTLCYNLQVPEVIYQRFPGVEGSAYLIGGVGVNYQRAADVTLAPIRTGVGIRLGASVGYLAYSRKRNALPF